MLRQRRRGPLLVLAAVIVACGSEAPSGSDASSETSTSPTSAVSSDTEPSSAALSSTIPSPSKASDSIAPVATDELSVTSTSPATVASTFPDLRPPADPIVLVGSVLESDFDESVPPPSILQIGAPITINGSPSNLLETGGTCLNDCDFAVELVADATALQLGVPVPVYLLLVSFVPGSRPSSPARLVESAAVIEVGREDSAVQLIDNGADGCSFEGLADGLAAVAVDIGRAEQPTAPDRVWVADSAERRLVEVEVEPGWICEFIGP